MTDMPETRRFSMPLLAVAQAQKEITHNEALQMIDAIVHPTVEAGPVAAIPSDPVEGQCWLVASGASGAWSGREAAIAMWTSGGWRFIIPRAGMRVLRLSDGASMRFDGDGWIVPAAIATPAGGATIDAEARAAIALLITQLVAHGILISG